MKHFIRKPVLPLLLALLLIFGIVFLTLFQKNIEDGEQEVETIYNNTVIYFRVLPGEKSGSELSLTRIKGALIEDVEGVTKSYGLMRTSYALVSPAEKNYEGQIYGTKNLEFMARENELVLHFFEGESQETFTNFSYDAVPCLVSEGMAEQLELEPGQEIQISPAGFGATGVRPVLNLYLAGVYEDPLRNLMGMVVPEELFMEDVSKPHLLYTSHMMYDCVYRQFSFEIDPKYNRDYLQIIEKTEKILPSGDKCEVVTNAKTLTNAVRPLERKLAVQKMLLPPLTLLICAAVAIVSLLLALSLRREIFLRLMWGEKRPLVLLKMLTGTVTLLGAASLLAVGTVLLTAGPGRMMTALGVLGLTDGLCLLAALIPLTVFCFRNLISLYQAGEG